MQRFEIFLGGPNAPNPPWLRTCYRLYITAN